MEVLSKVLVCLAAIAFVLAVVGALWSNTVAGIAPEALSRASNNLALLSIAVLFIFGKSKVESAA
jgi:hypothetical protein